VPTLVSALTLVALLRLSHLGLPPWHPAAWYAGVTAFVLAGSLSLGALVLNVAGSFLASALYFLMLDRTDNRTDRALHWLVLVGGFLMLIASRLYIDIKAYAVGLW
jgi:hypothetical protein